MKNFYKKTQEFWRIGKMLPALAVKRIKEIEPIALLVGIPFFIAGLFFGESPPFATYTIGQMAAYAFSQVLGLGMIVTLFQALATPGMRGKLGTTAIAATLNGFQYTILGLLGDQKAWPGVLAMSLAVPRALVMCAMTPRLEKMPAGKRRLIRLGIGAGFLCAGFGFMFTGFGLVKPLVEFSHLIQGQGGALVKLLPMVASTIGTISDIVPRTRYFRPIKLIGATCNTIYSGWFVASPTVLVSELGATVINFRQWLKQDMPPRKHQGMKLSFLQRFYRYGCLMMNPRLSETYFLDEQKAHMAAKQTVEAPSPSEATKPKSVEDKRQDDVAPPSVKPAETPFVPALCDNSKGNAEIPTPSRPVGRRGQTRGFDR